MLVLAAVPAQEQALAPEEMPAPPVLRAELELPEPELAEQALQELQEAGTREQVAVKSAAPTPE
jgi:hypothetical protein